MTFRFNSESKVKTQTVQNILDTYEVKGYSGAIDPETPIQWEGDWGGYAVKIQGYYTRAELLAIAEDLWTFNQSTPRD